MKKVLSILLVALMLLTMVPANAFAADATSVKLVSFMRGDVTDLRSSELLEVQVEGYDGNPRELTYKWTSSLGTYLYIYNSHNMYGINNTYGEMEIYNTDKNIKRNSNVEEDRSGDKTLTKKGFMWASVYGAYTYNGGSASNALKGTVKVEVFDKNGKSLGSDSFSSFKAHNLDGDLDNVVIGLFEGDRKNVLDLLGESGIVHITCSESSVSSADILKGDEHIAIETEKKDKNTYNYFIKGVKAGDNSTDGDAQLVINIKKSACKFHYNTSGNAEPIVYVFKKPKTATTTTTLTLVDDIDGRCEYFIDGNKGEKQPDGTVLFTGLTPNTNYTVEVRAEYRDGDEIKYVYGYVDDTTKPVYKATVKTYLDDALTDVSLIHGDVVNLHISKDGVAFVQLSETVDGIYEAGVEPGVYFLYHYENGIYHKASNYELVVEHANAELNLHHYTVKYDTNYGAFKEGEEVGTEIYPANSPANATSNVPVRENFIFVGWEYNGKLISSGNQITSSISAPIVLKAKWEKAVNVTINVIIDHKTADGFDSNPTKADLDVDFVEMTAGSSAFVETGDKLHFRKEKTTDENGNEKAYAYTIEDNVSKYTATDYTYTGLLESSTFGVALSKSGYDVGVIEKKQDKAGNWIINIPLTYNPDDFDIDFSIEMADDVPTELYPDAVIVKIAYWNTETNEWKIISQQETTGVVIKPGVRVDIDPDTGEGFGSYPVWKFDGDKKPYGYRAVVTGFIYGDSTIIVPTEKDHYKDDNTVIVTYTDGNYTATMSDIADGKKFSTSLNGAFYNGETNAQQGTLHGVITVEKYDVIFDANGGVNAEGKDSVKQVYRVPELDDYKPTMTDHKFLGWYKDKECTVPAVEKEILTKDITLYAKWDRVLTGSVRVAGSYLQDGHIVDVWAVDRAESAVVVLQEITDNGVYTIDRQTVDIVWTMSEMIYGISEEYKFTGLDPEKTYRTEILILNYVTTYQNSTTFVDGDGDYADDYNVNDFTAVYPETNKLETFVNAYLSFEPASYFQPVEVDATLIGENLRPDDTLVEIWYKATGTDNAYKVISQHTVEPYGIEIDMGKDGMDDGDYGYTVWNSVYDGALYDYQAHLSKINKTDAATWPVSVVYGEPSRYSPLNNAPTGVLQVKIIPNRFGIIYNENYVDEGVNVVSYGTHIWSYETAIDFKPVRDGYVFEGWYSNPECTGKKVTAIAETVAEDTNLYAKWEKRADLELTVNHVVSGTDTVLGTETKTAQTFGDEITAESLKKDFDGYSYESASAEKVTIGTGTNEITLYYTKRADLELTVNHVVSGTGTVLGTETKTAQTFGDEITAESLKKDFDGYSYESASAEKVTIGTGTNEITLYYTKRADLELTVNHVVSGTGTVLGTETKTAQTFGDEITAESLKKDFDGYSYESASAEKVTIGTGTNEITLYYTKRADLEFTVNHVVSGTDTVLGTETKTAQTFGDEITAESLKKDFDGYSYESASAEKVTIGTGTNEITLYYTKNSYAYTVNYFKEGTTYKLADSKTTVVSHGTEVTEKAMVIGKYVLVGSETQTEEITEEGIVINFYYTLDEAGGGKNGDKGDGTPDKYQKKVIFKVVNGTWEDDTLADKFVFLVLMKDGEYAVDGTASLTAPTGMKAGKDCEGGTWDVTPPAVVSGTNTETYTYSFTEIIPEEPENPEIPDVPETPEIPEGDGDGNGSLNGGAHHIVFGKTDGIGWYNVSKDGGQTWDIVFGNSTYEVDNGTELIIKAGDIMGDSFTFYVNGGAVKPNDDGEIRVTVNGYMLIGAIGIDPDIDFEVPDVEESLNWFQRIIKAIKDFFAKIFGKR